MITFQSSARFGKQALIVITDPETLKRKAFGAVNAAVKRQIHDLTAAGTFSAHDGEVVPFAAGATSGVLVGTGPMSKATATGVRTAIRAAVLSSFLKRSKDIAIVPATKQDGTVEAAIEAVLIGGYGWRKYLTPSDNKSIDPFKKRYTIICKKKKEYDDLIMVCKGVNAARDLINENADVANAPFIEKTIKNLIKGRRGVSAEILGEAQMKKKGLNLHLAVNRGSRTPPRLIIVRYNGAGAKEPYTALVGKGITFDTGGLNLKPSGHMETMRMDMSGAAAVIGVLHNALALRLKKNVLFVTALAENAIDAASYKPGDVIRGYSGKTVEIGNTDAEGRLVLADAMAYVVKNYKPARMVDIATLTGACVVALAHDYTGLMSNDDRFARQLCDAAEKTDDRAWRLPLYPELTRAIKSPIADIKSIGFPRGAGGTITAAEFLRQFVGETTWAHLDIAGTAFVDGDSRWYFGHGGTGASVRLLTAYLADN